MKEAVLIMMHCRVKILFLWASVFVVFRCISAEPDIGLHGNFDIYIEPAQTPIIIDEVQREWHVQVAQKSNLIRYGNMIFKKLGLRDFTQNPATPSEVRALIWYLFGRSLQAGHGFNEGTWVILGNKQELEKINDFFMSSIDPTGVVASIKNGVLSHLVHKKRRLSSHFREWKARHYGIDVSGLPVGKKHILFSTPVPLNSSSGQYKMYIKIENYGLSSLRDFIFHTKEYMGLEDCRSQYFRKEKVPDAVKKLWLQHASRIGIQKQNIQEGLRHGVHKMKSLVADRNNVPPELCAALSAYHTHAKGDEVVVDLIPVP